MDLSVFCFFFFLCVWLHFGFVLKPVTLLRVQSPFQLCWLTNTHLFSDHFHILIWWQQCHIKLVPAALNDWRTSFPFLSVAILTAAAPLQILSPLITDSIDWMTDILLLSGRFQVWFDASRTVSGWGSAHLNCVEWSKNGLSVAPPFPLWSLWVQFPHGQQCWMIDKPCWMIDKACFPFCCCWMIDKPCFPFCRCWMTDLVEWLTNLVEWLIDIVEWLTNLVYLSIAVEWLTNLVEGLTNLVEWLADLVEWLTNLVEGLTNLVFHSVIVEWLTNLVFLSVAVEWLANLVFLSVTVEWLTDLVEWLTNLVLLSVAFSFGLTPAAPLQVQSPLIANTSASASLLLNTTGQVQKMDPLLMLQVRGLTVHVGKQGCAWCGWKLAVLFLTYLVRCGRWIHS